MHNISINSDEERESVTFWDGENEDGDIMFQCKVCNLVIGRQTGREGEWEGGRGAGRQVGRKRGRQAGREAGREGDREGGR